MTRSAIALRSLFGHHRAGRVIREVDDEGFGFCRDLFSKRIRVQLEVVLLRAPDRDRFPPARVTQGAYET